MRMNMWQVSSCAHPHRDFLTPVRCGNPSDPGWGKSRLESMTRGGLWVGKGATTCGVTPCHARWAGAGFALASYGPKAPHCNMSSGSLDGIVIQKPAAQRLLALHLVGQGGLGRVIEVQRHDVADTLMWSAGVMVFLDVTQGVMQMGLAQENQLVEGLPNLAYMPLSVRITKGRMRGRF